MQFMSCMDGRAEYAVWYVLFQSFITTTSVNSNLKTKTGTWAVTLVSSYVVLPRWRS